MVTTYYTASLPSLPVTPQDQVMGPNNVSQVQFPSKERSGHL
jgi:hypothetical protein